MEWLNYHHLHYFWVVASEGSFTQAAARLRISQSAISIQVASLEQFLGKKLIVRSTSKKLSLTEEGQLVFSQAEEIFRQGRELVDGFRRGGHFSSIRFGATGGLSKNLQIKLLRPLLGSSDYELSVDVGDPSVLLSRLLSFQLDAILCDVPYPHSEDEPLIQKQIAKEHFCIVSRKIKGPNSLNDQIAIRGIYLPAKSDPATARIESFLKTHKLKDVIRGYIDDIALLRLLAVETSTFVALPRIGAEREIKSKELHIVHEFRSLFQEFFIVVRQKSGRANRLLSLLEQD